MYFTRERARTECRTHTEIHHPTPETSRTGDDHRIHATRGQRRRLQSDIRRWKPELPAAAHPAVRMMSSDFIGGTFEEHVALEMAQGEGFVLLNGARVSEATCPEVLKDWDKLLFTDMAPVSDEEVEFHR